jgi:hypothetical protein
MTASAPRSAATHQLREMDESESMISASFYRGLDRAPLHAKVLFVAAPVRAVAIE